MMEDEVIRENKTARNRMQELCNHLPEEDCIEIQAEDTEAHRVKCRRVDNSERKKYEMRFDTTEEEYLGIMNADNVDYNAIFCDSSKNLAKAVFLYYGNSGCSKNGQY